MPQDCSPSPKNMPILEDLYKELLKQNIISNSSVLVRKDDYIDAEQNVKIDYQQRTIDTIVMEPSDPNAGALEALNAFAGQYSYMYGNSYSVSGRISGGFIVRDYENLSSEGFRCKDG